MVKLYPSLRVRVNSLAFSIYRKQAAPWRVRHLFSILHGQVFGRKLAGKNAKEGIFTRFPGFRYRSIAGVRPFDYAQGPHPAATAAPPFQSGLGLISSTLLRNICLRQHKIRACSCGLDSAYAQGHAFLSGGSFL